VREFPGGERFADFTQRVQETARAIRQAHAHEEVALVSHGGPIRVIVGAALAMPRRALFRLDHSLAGISVIDCHDGSPIVRLLNVSVTGLHMEGRSSTRSEPQT
jgi:broad specificity phosphatase PhoE